MSRIPCRIVDAASSIPVVEVPTNGLRVVTSTAQNALRVRFSTAPNALRVSGLRDADTQAWVDAVIANGGTLTDSWISSVNTFVIGCKADGTWDSLLDVGLLCGADNLSGALVKLKTASGSRILTNTNFVSGDYTATGSTAGMQGDGTNKRLAAGSFSMSSASMSLGFYGGQLPTTGTGMLVAHSVLSTMDGTLHAGASVIANLSINARIAISASASNGLIIASRVSASDLRTFRNGSQVATNTASDATMWTTTFSPWIFGRNSDSLLLNGRGLAYFIGTGLTASQVSSLSTRLNALMTSIGANVY